MLVQSSLFVVRAARRPYVDMHAGLAGGLAGARAALTGQDAETRRAALAVDPGTTVVLLSTEGAAANPLPGAASDLG